MRQSPSLLWRNTIHVQTFCVIDVGSGSAGGGSVGAAAANAVIVPQFRPANFGPSVNRGRVCTLGSPKTKTAGHVLLLDVNSSWTRAQRAAPRRSGPPRGDAGRRYGMYVRTLARGTRTRSLSWRRGKGCLMFHAPVVSSHNVAPAGSASGLPACRAARRVTQMLCAGREALSDNE